MEATRARLKAQDPASSCRVLSTYIVACDIKFADTRELESLCVKPTIQRRQVLPSNVSQATDSPKH